MQALRGATTTSALVGVRPRPGLAARTPASRSHRARSAVTRGLGKDAAGAWLDITKLVTSGGGSGKGAYQLLEDKIGREVYCDFNGWHLYLRDLKAGGGTMAQALANELGQRVDRDGVDERDVEAVLAKVPLSLGGGRKQVSLLDTMSGYCVQDLVRVLQDWEREK
ncbi:unnamed protein product [Pedinophyceae sp. YPF-701]|nr:unnamed protein product [Pedinophyceae sp. YPF-701]